MTPTKERDGPGRALKYLERKARGLPLADDLRVTINFHPDTCIDNSLTIASIARDGLYRSQFETRTSNGGLTAYPGGARWLWENRMFGGAYGEGEVALRPKYGALNHRYDQMGGARRFGSCYLTLRSHVLWRTTFCYPDSFHEPQDFGTASACDLVAMCDQNVRSLDPILDNYIEAHVHGILSISSDVETVVLDPSYRETEIEEWARSLGCPVEWHAGYQLTLNRMSACEHLRGPAVAEALVAISRNGVVTPKMLGDARRDVLDYQIAKWAWHCVARFGEKPSRPAMFGWA